MTATTSLAEGLDRLAAVAARAGLDPAAARDEGLRVAAALAEPVPGAAADWAAAAGLQPDDLAAVNTAFFEAASRGRRWRSAPTDLLEGLAGADHARAIDYAEALHEVAAAAVTLGTAPSWVILNATATSAIYLAAARVPVALPDGSAPTKIPGLDSPPLADGPFSTGGPGLNSPSGDLGTGLGIGGLPPLPSGPGTEAVLRSWGLGGASVPGSTPAPPSPDGTVAGDGSPLSGIPTVGGPAAAQDAATEPTAPAEPVEPEKSVEELLDELDSMIGLERVKKEIHRQVALLTVEKMRMEAGLKPNKLSRHLIFVGNPGTGKTTVARLIGAIYRALGLLEGGQLIEVDRSELVAGYVGQTAMKTAEVCASAIGGVLFIDEAYALTGDQYAQESVNTLVKEMEDHREDLVVIVAGYPEPMVAFIAQNPGLASRFTTTIEFDDYTDDELIAILRSIAAGADYDLSEDAERRVRMMLEATPRTPAFGNGRFSRNLFEHSIGRHAWRLKDATDPTVDELRLLTVDDVTEALDQPAGHEQPDVPDGSEGQDVHEGAGEFRDAPDGPPRTGTAGSGSGSGSGSGPDDSTMSEEPV